MASNPRLQQAYSLLRELIEQPAAAGDAAESDAAEDQSTWNEPPNIDLQPWLTSATDLLIAWAPDRDPESELAFTAPRSTQKSWDRYFGAFSQTTPAAPVHRSAPATADIWNSEAAEAAVECLFRFVHALEKCDIEGAMSCIHPQYHAVENDREIERHMLRIELENFLDRWRGQGVRVSLAEVPDPIFHPAGILILITLQIDLAQTTHLLGRLCVLSETPAGWLISSLAHMIRTPRQATK